MLTITEHAVEAIKAVMSSEDGGVRITTVPGSTNGRGPSLAVEPAQAPEPDDAVLDAEGAQLYVEAAALGVIDGKVLDAEVEGTAVRFSIVEPG